VPLDIQIVPIASHHDRAAFSCGESSVDHYLRQIALSAEKRNLARTKVAIMPDAPARILGYYTIVYHEYREAELPSEVEQGLKVAKLRRIPMLLLAQLGVLVDMQGQGLSKALLQHAFRSCLTALKEVGAVAIITDPIDERAEAIYTKYGFVRLQPEEPRMILPIRTLRSALTP